MTKIKSPNALAGGLWKDYGPWLIILAFVYILYSFRRVFSALGNAAGDKIEGAVVTAQTESQTKTDRAKVQAVTGSKVNYTDAQLATFRADADALAGYLGTSSALSAWEKQFMFANDTAAFSLLKQRYSRLALVNNLPYVWAGAVKANGKRDIKNVTKEVPECVKSNINWKVLIPAYKDATDGRNLLSDLRDTLTGSSYKKLLNFVL